MAQSVVFCAVFCISLFVLLAVIVLSFILDFTGFKYLFGIFKFLLIDNVDVANIRQTFYVNFLSDLYTNVTGNTILKLANEINYYNIFRSRIFLINGFIYWINSVILIALYTNFSYI